MRLRLLISALGIFGAALIGMGLFHGWWWAKPYPHRTGDVSLVDPEAIVTDGNVDLIMVVDVLVGVEAQ